MEPLNNEVEDMFADTEAGSVPPVQALLPTEVVSAPAISTPKASWWSVFTSNLKFWLWRWRKAWLVLVIVIVTLVLAGIVVYWLRFSVPPTESTTNTTPVVIPSTNTNATNTTNTPVTNQTPLKNPGLDTDFDGLSDEEEIVYNTNPKKKDTDEDGLSDREEVRVYGTDPRNPDTDADTYEDGEEVTHFYDPNSTDPKKRLFELPK